MHVKIVTRTSWPSFRNVAVEIQCALRNRCSCRVYDWKEANPGGKILFIGTLDNRTLEFIDRLSKGSDLVYYVTTEGLSQLDDSCIRTARHLKSVAVSEFVNQMIGELGIVVADVVHHGINMRKREVDVEFKKECVNRTRDRKTILTVSANHQRKGLDRLLEAYQILEQQVPDVFLILHSQREGYYDLEKMVATLGIRSIWLTEGFGQITQRQLNSLYDLCTAYVQPSYSEGFGLPILEAFRFDKAPIAVDAPPFNEIIKHGENGLLVPQRDVSWFNFKNSIKFKMHTYAGEDLARAMEIALLDEKLATKVKSKIQSEKMNWDAQLLYPKLLDYFD
ncbi:MAG: glycosyltransferase [Candidatus Bathyarchaeia archaeon]|jgi:glycosyltransferase involved in cell wall biosynthesis